MPSGRCPSFDTNLQHVWVAWRLASTPCRSLCLPSLSAGCQNRVIVTANPPQARLHRARTCSRGRIVHRCIIHVQCGSGPSPSILGGLQVKEKTRGADDIPDFHLPTAVAMGVCSFEASAVLPSVLVLPM